MKYKIGFVLCLICIPAFSAFDGMCEKDGGWPKVMPLDKHFQLSDKGESGVKLTIFGEDKKALYLLQCFLNAFDRKDADFTYTGVFECRLIPLPFHDFSHKNLLTSENPQLRDWDTRGVYQVPELFPRKVEGVLIEYPGRGRVRDFRLRGMQIRISVSHVALEPKQFDHFQRINRLDLEVEVLPDANAQSSVAEPIDYSNPLYTSIRWPKITPMQQKIHFVGHQLSKISIMGQNRKPLYALYCCLNPTDNDQIEGYEFAGGDFHCFLFSTYDTKFSGGMLLCDNPYPTRDWEGRGIFLVSEITGDCAKYPDYGREREFRLRGMDLTLSIASLKLDSSVVKSGSKKMIIKDLNLEVTAVPDSTVISAIAGPSKYVEPVTNCDSVLVRH